MAAKALPSPRLASPKPWRSWVGRGERSRVRGNLKWDMKPNFCNRHQLEPPGNPHKRFEIVRRVGQADIDPGIELQVVGHFVSHPEVGGSNPARVALGADFTVEFCVAFQFSIEAMLKGNRMDKVA